MKSLVFGAQLFACLFFLTSCSTIINGSSQDVFFNSDPIGSIVEIEGSQLGETPCTLKLKRKKAQTIVLKKEGYESSCIYIKKGFEPVFLGNIILGGPIGMLVDVCSGAVYKLSPDNNFVILKPLNLQDSGFKAPKRI